MSEELERCYYVIDEVPLEDAVHYAELCKEGKYKEAKAKYPELYAHIEKCDFCADFLGSELTDDDLLEMIDL